MIDASKASNAEAEMMAHMILMHPLELLDSKAVQAKISNLFFRLGSMIGERMRGK